MSRFSDRRFKVCGLTLSLVFAVTGWTGVAMAQGGGGGGQRARPANAPPAEIIGMIPIKDPLTVEKCSRCHVADAKGNLARISNVRSTPEGWEEAIKRMVRLDGLQLTPDEARKILRYLSDTHGLAPEEASPVEYFAEHRLIDEKFPDTETQHACASCHAIAKPMSWRRNPEDWDLLKNMHLAFFPSINNSFGAGGGGGAAAAAVPAAGRRGAAAAPATGGAAPAAAGGTAADVALAFIKKSTPLVTPEWASWSAMVQTPKLAGTWMVTGYMPGKGKFFGKMKIDATGDTYATTTDLSFVDGSKFSTTGTSLIYTGYAWRGRTKGTGSIDGIEAPNGTREVMMLSKDQSTMTGRWFWGTYEEFGMDVTLHRESVAPTVFGTDISSLRTGSTDATVKIYGSHLPATLTASDINLGTGVTVTKVVSSTPELVTVTATVAPAASTGPRLISVAGATLPEAYTVYEKMDFLRVTPTTSIAHLGSEPHAKGYMQFEAIAYSYGADGKPNTDDDVALGPVPATWRIDEFIGAYGDDDVQFVGKMDPKTGFFTPGSDGPNPKRKSMRNNYGDVWSVATYTPPGSTTPLVGKGYLIVGVPQYVQWDQPEVAQ